MSVAAAAVKAAAIESTVRASPAVVAMRMSRLVRAGRSTDTAAQQGVVSRTVAVNAAFPRR
jgi:hypothetical protein